MVKCIKNISNLSKNHVPFWWSRLHKIRTLWLIISYQLSILLKRATKEYVWFLLTWDLDNHNKDNCKWTNFSLFVIYVENGAICCTETTKLTGCFVPRADSAYIWSFYRHNKNQCMQKLKADEARKWKNMAFCLLPIT